jgi:predicted ribosomally synthesized peptide with SipW-like signal peptide
VPSLAGTLKGLLGESGYGAAKGRLNPVEKPEEEKGRVMNRISKILASVFVIGVLGFAMGWGTFSYFSSIKTSTDNTFTAGILSMTGVTASFSCPSGWAPGDSFTATWSLKNDGNIPIKYLAVDIHNDRWTGADLADVINITAFKEYIPGYGWIDNLAAPQSYQTLVKDGVDPFTLKELMQSYVPSFGEPAWSSGYVKDEFGGWVKHTTDWITGYGYDITPGPAIVVGGTYELLLTFKFLESAGNAYQGATTKIDITFMGIQDISQAP